MSSKDDLLVEQDVPGNLEELGFDQWCKIHQDDPDRFDIYRLKILNDFIDSAPERSKRKLRGLMFMMEGESRRSKSQLSYNMRLSSMMMGMLSNMREQLVVLGSNEVAQLEASILPGPSAEILPFVRPDTGPEVVSDAPPDDEKPK